ncbi:hypothetical protein CGLO_13299 [Colletotrichum gloeosporioides Cg-14]|uniref:Uncharacterized protein n=1 Tax=Colletotrichum gloeosporioides (strain Cg-14) TaxID=1237896 RepID=T0K420_COLGC|nr:hypothetical protein CGLO_13299 [Colletotrichum gloeosporioides Cg-14]
MILLFFSINGTIRFHLSINETS